MRLKGHWVEVFVSCTHNFHTRKCKIFCCLFRKYQGYNVYHARVWNKKKIRIHFWFTAVVPIVIYASIKYYNGPERLICQATSTSGCRNKQGPREKSQSSWKPSMLLPNLWYCKMLLSQLQTMKLNIYIYILDTFICLLQSPKIQMYNLLPTIMRA